jgi:hypothetical protein
MKKKEQKKVMGGVSHTSRATCEFAVGVCLVETSLVVGGGPTRLIVAWWSVVILFVAVMIGKCIRWISRNRRRVALTSSSHV